MVEGEVIRIVGKAAVRGAGHWIMRALSVGAVFGAIWLLWVGLIQPHTKWRLPTSTTTQQAQVINNNEYNFPEKEYFLDFKLWFLRLKAFPNRVSIDKIIKQTSTPLVNDEDGSKNNK